MSDVDFKYAMRLLIGKKIADTEVIKLLLQAEGCECLRIFYNKYGMPIGFVVWNKMVKESLMYACKGKGSLAEQKHFSQGNILLIRYALFADSWRHEARRCFINFLKQHRAFAYVRKTKFGFRVRKGGTYRNRLDLLG